MTWGLCVNIFLYIYICLSVSPSKDSRIQKSTVTFPWIVSGEAANIIFKKVSREAAKKNKTEAPEARQSCFRKIPWAEMSNAYSESFFFKNRCWRSIRHFCFRLRVVVFCKNFHGFNKLFCFWTNQRIIANLFLLLTNPDQFHDR